MPNRIPPCAVPVPSYSEALLLVGLISVGVLGASVAVIWQMLT